MSELLVTYDISSRKTHLKLDGLPSTWSAIRRVCIEQSDQVEILDNLSLTIPWWAYLGARTDINYYANRKSFTIVFDQAVKEKLDKAEQRKEDYERACNSSPIDFNIIQKTLDQQNFIRKLTKEQKRNVGILGAMASGATFSIPGAGKTTEALSYYVFKRSPGCRLLVIAPKNAFTAWEGELGECMPKEKQFSRLTGGQAVIENTLKNNPIHSLITYHQLPNVVDLIADFLSKQSSMVFLDESHRIKRGTDGVIGNTILSISDIPDHKLILSGTPMPNHVTDLIAQFRFLYPAISVDETDVQEKIQPIYVRTTKAELRLPPIKVKPVPIPMSQAQFELYELLRSEAARQASDGIKSADRRRLRKAGQSALRLLQAASNPGLLSNIEFDHPDLLADALEEGNSPKIDYACNRARELAYHGQKTIIWSSFVKNVELIANRLRDLGGDFIHGGVDAGDEDEQGTREQKIKRFHDDDQCSVLVANPAACGEGISLHTVCHNAIYVDRTYNAAQYLQSQDRIHRIGLEPGQNTYVEILFSPDTVDESVQRRIDIKIENMAIALNDKSLIIVPELIDFETDGFNHDDFLDLKQHLSSGSK